MTLPDRPSLPARAWSARWPFGAELVLFLVLNVTYEWLRDLVATEDITRPLEHARQIVDAQEAMGLLVEADIHDWVLSIGWVEFLTTWTYTLAHTTGFVAMFLFMWFFRREQFAFFRNWFWLTNGIAVIGYWLYPLAPPRLSGFGFEDPTKESLELGGALSWFQPFRNEFAAMPSMHVGYTVLFALTLFLVLRPSPWRWLAWLWPAGMLFVVMATANHWWLDCVGGAVCVGVGLLAAHLLCDRSFTRPWAARA